MGAAILSFVLSAFAVGLSATLPPGPIFAMTVTESAKWGFMGGFLVIVGHAIVEVIVATALIFGFGVFLGSDSAKIFISILGGLTLILMGYNLVRGVYKTSVQLPERGIMDKRVQYRSLISGIVAAVANPYFIIWWALAGGAFIFYGLELLGLIGAVIFLLCHWASDFTWFSFISFCVSRGRKLLSTKLYRGTIIICGIFLLIIGLKYFSDGIILIL